MQLLSGLVRRSNVKVVLTGEGADEVLGGYDIFKESKVRQFWAQQPDSTLAAGAAQAAVSVSRSHVGAERGVSQGILRRRSRESRRSRVSRTCRAGRPPRSASCSGRTICASRSTVGASSACATRCRRRWRAGTVQSQRIPRSEDAVAELPAVVAGRSHAHGELGRRAFPVPRSPPDRVRQPAAPPLQDARAAREVPAQGNHARPAARPPFSSATSSPIGRPDAAAFFGREHAGLCDRADSARP